MSEVHSPPRSGRRPTIVPPRRRLRRVGPREHAEAHPSRSSESLGKRRRLEELRAHGDALRNAGHSTSSGGVRAASRPSAAVGAARAPHAARVDARCSGGAGGARRAASGGVPSRRLDPTGCAPGRRHFRPRAAASRPLARDQLDVTQVPVGHDRAGLVVLDRTGGDPEEPGQLLLRETGLLARLPDPRSDPLTVTGLHPHG